MKEIVTDKNLVAYCGLYCGACRSYLQNRCKGCHENIKASWCRIRSCCIEHKYLSCANCTTHSDPNRCSFFNNLVSKIFAFIFKSDRKACIEQIRIKGIEHHAREMSSKGLQSIKKN